MKLKYILLISALLLPACNQKAELRQEINILKFDKIKAESDLDSVRSKVDFVRSQLSEAVARREQMNKNIAELTESEAYKKAIASGKTIRYILKVSIRQVSYSFSISKQLRDAVNEEEFEIYTDKETYDAANPGMDLFDSFRVGSAIMRGSLGSWRLKVVSKRIVR